MSVADFEMAISHHPDLRFAIVSEALFYALDDLDKIEIKQITQALPAHRLPPGPVLTFFRGRLRAKARPLVLTYFILKARPDVHIEFAVLHGLRVDDEGPNSYVLCDRVAASTAPPELCAACLGLPA